MTLEQIAGYALMLLASAGGVVPLTNWLKEKIGASGFWALLLSAGVSVVAGILTLWEQGQLVPGSVSWGNLTETAFTVFFAAQVFFRLIKKAE